MQVYKKKEFRVLAQGLNKNNFFETFQFKLEMNMSFIYLYDYLIINKIKIFV